MRAKPKSPLFVLCFLLALVAHALPARAGNLDAANAAYQRGEYETAIRDYEAIVAEGVIHEDLYYNLGNAYYRSERLGPAIFNYERALRVAPGEEDVEYNLSVARQAVAAGNRNQLRGAEADPWWVRFALTFSIAESTLALLLLNFFFFACLLVLRFLAAGFTRTAIVVITVFLGAGVGGSAVLLSVHAYANEKLHHGIVTADLVVMREGPDSTLEERGQLHPGLRVTVLAREPEWLLVRLANGVEGWVPRDSVGLFR